jgi:hypothetical protein
MAPIVAFTACCAASILLTFPAAARIEPETSRTISTRAAASGIANIAKANSDTTTLIFEHLHERLRVGTDAAAKRSP